MKLKQTKIYAIEFSIPLFPQCGKGWAILKVTTWFGLFTFKKNHIPIDAWCDGLAVQKNLLKSQLLQMYYKDNYK